MFDKKDVDMCIQRINKLSPTSERLRGKMTVDQMLAHCNIPYEMTYESIHPKPGFIKKCLIQWFAKDIVVSDKPYKKNAMTAPEFIIKEEKDFKEEKKRLITYIKKTLELGEKHFDGKESHSFGPLTTTQRSNLFGKHLDHHLTQFGV